MLRPSVTAEIACKGGKQKIRNDEERAPYKIDDSLRNETPADFKERSCETAIKEFTSISLAPYKCIHLFLYLLLVKKRFTSIANGSFGE